MTHKGRCFRDRRKLKRRRIRQALRAAARILSRHEEMFIPEVAEIPLPEPRAESPVPKEYAKPEKEVSFKRRSW